MPRRPVLLATAVAAYLLGVAWLYRGSLMDDAYIGLRYVANLLAGQGFVFNPPVRVEGVSNIGWLLVMAPLAAVLGPPLAAKVLALVLMGLTLALVYAAAARLATRLGNAETIPSPLGGGGLEQGGGQEGGAAARDDVSAFALVPALAVLTTAAHAEFAMFSLLGMETACLSAVLAAMVWLAGRPRGLGWLPPLGALAFLVHPEAVLVFPLGAALAWASGALSGRKLLRGTVLFAACLAGLGLARWAYFGALLPNTFSAKPGGAFDMALRLPALLDGSLVNVSFPFSGLFALPFLVAGYCTWHRAEPRGAAFAAAACMTGLLFGLYAKADWTQLGRYFAPYVPAAFLLLLTGLVRAEELVLSGERGARWVRAAGVISSLGIAAAAAAVFALLGEGSWRDLRDEAAVWLWGALVLVWTAATELGRRSVLRRNGARGAGAAAIALAAAIGLCGGLSTLYGATERMRLGFPGYILTSQTLVAPSLWLRDHLPAGATIATRRIGAVAYYSERPVFDYTFGLTEREVARLIRDRRGEIFGDPNAPPLAELWRERSPDFFLEDREVLFWIAKTAGGTPSRFSIHGLDYAAVRRFPIGDGAEWILAQRLAPRAEEEP